MQLQLSTWPQIEAYFRASKTVLVPIGSTEQHGPTGLIGTDALTAEAVARAVGERAGVLVAPTLPIGMALHHMAFAGSMTLRPSTLIAVVSDVVLALARHGARRVLFVNGHGGNIPTVQAGFFEAYGLAEAQHLEGAADLRCKLFNWWQCPEVSELARTLYGDAEGMHATPSEVALTWHLHPACIQRDVLEPRVAPTGPIHGPADYRARFPDGRIGSDPSLATPEHGARFLDCAAEACVRALRAFEG